MKATDLPPRYQQQINENHRQTSSAESQQAVCHESLATPKRKGKNAGRLLVRITSYRQRLTDPDNLCGKYFLDCCRYCGFLRDDSAAEIDFKISQIKVKTKLEERTEIEITEAD
jgi:Holliday junction resolvase RusA-like endonuclease